MNTLLELVNEVLIELREEEVSAISGDEYASLIARFVNRAHRQVEDAWDWSVLYKEVTINTVADQKDYPLTNEGNRVKIDFIVNTETGGSLQESARRWVNQHHLSSASTSSQPTYWANNGSDSNGDAIFTVYPSPDAAYELVASFWTKSPDLSSEADVVVVPKQPIIDLALAYAARERGEVGGTTSVEYFEMAKRSLSDAIDIDRGRVDYESDWYTV